MKRTEILISGFGGQGVVRLGQIFSTAAVYQGLYTTMLVSHGTETRGGYVRSQIVIAGQPVDSPVVECPDYFCAMSRSAYQKFGSLAKTGVIIFDPGYVEPDLSSEARHVPLSARDIAVEELGRDIFANIVFLGVLGRFLKAAISKDCFYQALAERVPRFQEENKKAFALGYANLEGRQAAEFFPSGLR
ncbi:2-oxoacid:acceptor oxidoreductase family protein|uniref:2-oxoglutarate ferredoxin oxidoreductase, gamma subunit n=1 Tax=Dendrosporobacter quercicolus TaxID=146817 RepID=A0A1G9U1E3_9FIRM|nr:2-oxoacid:acceptor oxidoreductase family protein [Dendrosporobacter quercicolus]NSL48786.1 2-oxoacid:acceptor oxidoreductase family protein [Dendrosporobacter quercicolus DSM 1736]SDM53756.1 2-oxoglutarate ferredoxin oxidoreductase, gamma subunit [Dendrosporobacter quercicolus]